MSDTITFDVETETGTTQVPVDLSSDLGDITPDEYKLMVRYVARSGITDRDRAWAGAHVLLKLYRQVDVEADALIEAVIDGQ